MHKFFRTVLRDMPSSEMGFTYSHEHIVIDDCFVTRKNPGFLLNDSDKISEELSNFFSAGGRTVVDTMPANAGRNVELLAEVSKNSRVNIIVPTGIHLEMYYPETHWRYQYSEDQLTDLFIADIVEGVDKFDYSGPIIERTTHKAGLIKLATGDEPFTPHQQKIFRAVVNTHLATGVPILTHTNFGRHALEQAKLFIQLGACPEHIVLSHVDRAKDVDYNRAVLDTGVRVEYDSAFRWKKEEPNYTFLLLEHLLPEYPNQITLGMDMAKNAYWKSYGGQPGLNYLIEEIPKFLQSKGLEHYYNNLFIENPQQLYSFFRTL
ncbi:phosphotriesterase family protein [Maribacter hydrothermalis]|uniref:Aryldialkylphosphatase n=1 Tax=Maribacter hydrothermalis TaxID=1836467 RepID=A0A1B7Z1R2_9FLAO|nr:aryldialkylphosphatase [Maribacter hydrothermalis]APQ18307.1 aryldialkylphosphatase [Maribacter hydrothermalis]OBR36653.1 aryldialkylphosphatase [Maribacter hydrothermalis]